MSAPFFARCPHCGKGFQLKSVELLGKKVRCRGCRQVFVAASDLSLSVNDPPGDWWDEPGAVGEDPMTVDDHPDVEFGPELPALPVKKKKKKRRTDEDDEDDDEPRRFSWHNEDGELLPPLQHLVMIATGLLGGLAGAVVWAGFIALTGIYSAYMALLVGYLVGSGVRLGASKHDYGWGPALTALFTAVAAIVIGQVAAINIELWRLDRELQGWREKLIPVLTSDEGLVRTAADEIIRERKANGIEVDWSSVDEDLRPGYEVDEDDFLNPEFFEDFYPPDVWGEAEQRVEFLSAEEKAGKRKEIEQALTEGTALREFGEAGYISLSEAPDWFTPLDFFFFLVASLVAFYIAAGMAKD